MNPDSVLMINNGYLRPLTVEHIHPRYIEGLNDPEVNQFLEVRFENQTLETVFDFVNNNQISSNSVLWGIWKDGIPEHVGTVRIHGVEYRHRTANIGICLFDKRVWGVGFGQRAIVATTSWAINELGMRWVEAGIYEENSPSIKAFLKSGYKNVYDIRGKYMLGDKPSVLKIFSVNSNFK